MPTTIEKIAVSDAAQNLEFLRKVGGETDNLSFGAEGLPITVEGEKAFIEQFQDSRDGIMLVAKEDGRIVGNASLTRLPRRMSHRGELSVSVLRSHWNRGIGSLLMQELLAFAKENGFSMIDLQVRSDNRSAIHLYEKYGFQKLCTYPGFFRIDGKLIDFDYMFLSL